MKKLLYALLIITIVLGSVYACMDYFFGGMCGNQIVEEIPSPNKKLKAIIFTRDCGATTGFSTQLSILEIDDELENETGNTFILSDKAKGPVFDNGGSKIKVIWVNDNSLTVYFDRRTDVGKQEEEVEDIEVTYERLRE
jgi:hypothetical protein